MTNDLNKKVNNAIKLLKMAESEAFRERENNSRSYDIPNNVVEISYSGGKDSDVILRLAQLAGIKHIPVYKHTGIDPAGTIQHARSVGAIVLKPKMPFFRIIEKKGYPTRRARFCCSILKEYKVLEVSVQGIRTTESKARAERYKEPQICRMYNKKDHVQVFLPLLDWNDEDIKQFIEAEGIRCHPHYYDDEGNFHVERRLGCMCCPLQSIKKLKADFKVNPLMVKAYIRHGKKWWDNHPNATSHNNFQSIYDLFFHNIFCYSYNDYMYKTTGIFGRLDTKTFMEDYFSIDLP